VSAPPRDGAPHDGAHPGGQGPNGTPGAEPGRLEPGEVRAMFDRIAGVYDLLNSAMTAGLHHRWRARAADLAHIGPGARVLDLATGTGDLAIELARRVSPGGEVIGADFSEGMLDRARAKVAPLTATDSVCPRFEWADAMSLPYPDDRFDALTVGFGVRNFDDLARGLAEMVRVVRPGGRVVVLEMTTPTRAPLSWFYGLWFDRIIPAFGCVAGVVAKRLHRAPGATVGDAYRYLPSSVKRFPGPAALARELECAGLCGVRYLITAGGIVAIHAGTVAGGTVAAGGGRAS
jgi:demethylmenaquinone methyltransferase / 2-methoxy-6-polyprenyl-1,4-benzoquinol methylase